MSIKVSVIIPIYNVEKYLKQCVDSVLNQSYQNLEIILVDDGSPDGCPQICDDYQKKDERIIVIHKLNGGLSSARNAGMKVVTGNYIIFLDSDDFWDDINGLARLVERIEITNPDVLSFSYKKFYEDDNVKKIAYKGKKSRPLEFDDAAKQLDYITLNSLYIACAWNKIIRSELLQQGMCFEEGIFSEDIEWCARLLCKARNYDFLNEPFYCYRQRRDSITHTFGEKSCIDLKNNIIACVKKAEKLDDGYRKYLYRYIAYQISTYIIVQALAEVSPTCCIEELESYSWILKYHANNKKVFLVKKMCGLIGFKNICRIVRFMKTY